MSSATFEPGQRIIWRHSPRGGYGYVFPIPGEVVKVCGARIRIRVLRNNGQPVERYVRPEHLRPAKGETRQ